MIKDENLIVVLKQYNDNAKYLAFLNTGVLAFFIVFLDRLDLPKLVLFIIILLTLVSIFSALLVILRTLRDIEFLNTKQRIIEVDFKLIKNLWLSSIWCFAGVVFLIGNVAMFNLLS